MAKPKNHCFRWPKAPASHDHVKRSNNNCKNNKPYGLPGKPSGTFELLAEKRLPLL